MFDLLSRLGCLLGSHCSFLIIHEWLDGRGWLVSSDLHSRTSPYWCQKISSIMLVSFRSQGRLSWSHWSKWIRWCLCIRSSVGIH